MTISVEFRPARENLLSLCKKIIDLDFSSPKISSYSSWGADGHRIVAAFVNNPESGGITSATDYEKRQVIRSYLSNHTVISRAIVPRMQLIQMSCSKISGSWSGTSSDLNEFRYIAERYAVLNDILNKVEKVTGKLSIQCEKDLFQVNDICSASMGTRFNWHDLHVMNFEEMEKTHYKFEESRDIQDMTSKSVMGPIDRVGKTHMVGLRPFYDFCCEFVHPNIGDFLSCSLETKFVQSKDGDFLRRRNLSCIVSPDTDQKEAGENQFIIKSYIFAAKILTDLTNRAADMRELVLQSNRETKKRIHKRIEGRKSVFDSREICPCGSGKSVKICLRRQP